MSTLIRAGTLGQDRPLPISPRDRSSGEVVSLLRVVWLSLMKGSWPIPALALGLVFLDQLDLGHSGSCWLMYRGPLDLLTNRCLVTPRVITLINMFAN